MTAEQNPALNEALNELAKIAALPEKKRPALTRHLARALLVPLGEQILAEGEASAKAELARALALREPLGENWGRAVIQELELAASEHIQGVDPRYLDLPNYDFEYVFLARERLAARLSAAGALGYALRDDLLARIARADAVLEAHR